MSESPRKPLRAFRCSAMDTSGIVSAECASKARFSVWDVCKELGYKVRFGEVRVRRAAEYDWWAAKQTDHRRCISEEYINAEAK